MAAETREIDIAAEDNIVIGDEATKYGNTALGVGVLALVGAVVIAGGLTTHFLLSYVVAFMYVLSIGLGALWFVTIQHLTNAKWSVVVRRVAEIISANMGALGVLALLIIGPMAAGLASEIYVWLDHEKVHTDHLLEHKAGYLNLTFFVIRCVIYFGFWSFLAQFFLNKSEAQDKDGKPETNHLLYAVSAPSMIAFALTLTFCAFDFMMSIDYTWFSTIFGVYYFAGSVISGYSFLALSLMWLQKRGRLTGSVNREHYHDIGKMMFAFVVFWSYIAFSQFMLIWYGDIPEETHWYKWRFNGGWKVVSGALLFCHFVIPFFGLLSRHIKRNRKTLAFWAIWLLVIHYVDLYWLVMPSFPAYNQDLPSGFVSLACSLLCWIGLVSIFVGLAARRARGRNLVPTKDPRLADSLAFENI